jgi:hypothetical protein
MSSLLSEMFGTNRKRKNNIRQLELCQGFNLKPGLSTISSVERDREGPIGNLYNSLKSLNKMKGVSPHELETETRILFDELGPELWPRDASRAWWLTTQQHYPKHLCYEDGGDRARYVFLKSSQLLLSLINSQSQALGLLLSNDCGKANQSCGALEEETTGKREPTRGSSKLRQRTGFRRGSEPNGSVSQLTDPKPFSTAQRHQVKPIHPCEPPLTRASHLTDVRVFLEVRRPPKEPEGCWSIALDEMDIFTGERLRTQLLDGDALQPGESVLRAHIRPEPHHDDYDGPSDSSLKNVQLSFTAFANREQTDWDAMLEGLQTFYWNNPTASDLKLRATLVVGRLG